MKLKRRNGLTVGIITLSAVALTSVGFAAWVISAGDSAEVTGNIEVDSVTDSNHNILGIYEEDDTVKIASGTNDPQQSIKYGSGISKTGSSSNWLSYDSDTAYESLTATYYVQIENTTNAHALTSVKLEVIENTSTRKGVSGAASDTVGDNYFYQSDKTTKVNYSTRGFAAAQALTLVDVPAEVSVSQVTGGDLTALTGRITDEASGGDWLKITFTFKWGALFNASVADYTTGEDYAVGSFVKSAGKLYQCKTAITGAPETLDSSKWYECGSVGNPYVYYNKMGSSDTIAQSEATGFPAVGALPAYYHAKQFLTALDNLLDGTTFKLTIQTYGDASEKEDKQATFDAAATAGEGYQSVQIVTEDIA